VKNKPLVIGVGVAAVAIVVAAGVGGFFVYFGGSLVEYRLKTMAAEVSRQLPMRVDRYTEWTGIEAGPGKVCTYHYTVSVDPSELDLQLLERDVKQKALATPEMQPMFRAGVTIWYKYYDQSGKKFCEFSINRPQRK
jgi:hypothetical protein